MTIRLNGDEFWEQFQEVDEEELQWDASDKLDVTEKFDTRIAKGWWRDIQLRQGIWLIINKAQHRDRVIVNYHGQRQRNIHFNFVLSGKLQSTITSIYSEIVREIVLPCITGKYSLESNGLLLQNICDCPQAEPYSELTVEIKPETLLSFAASPDGELPKNLQHLVKTPDEIVYARSGDTTSEMTRVLQQILNCSYQGIVKRAYLESKVIELVALVLDHEVAIQQGEIKKVLLKPEQIERIHYAKEILLQDLSNPPSLEDLARQAGLNDFMLKKGFHEVFDTTVFGVLRDRRLTIAKQLLAEQIISIAEISHMVGYVSPKSFSRAFKRKFGLSPISYRQACR